MISKNTHLSFTQGAGHGGSILIWRMQVYHSIDEDRDPYPNARGIRQLDLCGDLFSRIGAQGGKIVKLPAFTQ